MLTVERNNGAIFWLFVFRCPLEQTSFILQYFRTGCDGIIMNSHKVSREMYEVLCKRDSKISNSIKKISVN